MFLDTLYKYRQERRFLLHEFVVMPEHFHLLLTPATCLTLERSLQLIKGGYSHRVTKELGLGMEIWERGFTDHRIRDDRDFDQHRQYIYRNPVERGIATEAICYPYCSAFPGFELDLWPSAAKARPRATGCGTT